MDSRASRSSGQPPPTVDTSSAPDFRLIFEASPHLYLILSPEFRIVAVNDAYLRATMTERSHIVGRGIFDVFPDNPNDPAADGVRNLTMSLERVVRTGEADTMAVQKYDIRRPGSEEFEERYWSPINWPVRDAQGRVAYILHSVEDVTEMLRLRRQREQVEESFRLLVEGTTEYAICMLDLQGRVINWNRGAERITGYSTDEIVGKHFSCFFTVDDLLEEVPDSVLLEAASRGRFEGEGVRVRKDGSPFWAHVVISALYDAEGKLRGYSKITRDVTEKKQAEENARHLIREEAARRAAEDSASVIREQSEQMRVTLESIGDAVIAADDDGRVRFLNPVAESLTGWRDAEARGRPLDEVLRLIDEETREPVECPGTAALRSGSVVILARRTLLISRDGVECPIADSAAPIRDRAGRVSGVVLVFRDVTESKLLEERYRQSQKMEAVGQLAGGVAHDFNNLLTVILGCCECLENDGAISGESRTWAGEIHKAADRAAGLTRQLLAFSRQQILKPRLLDLNEVIADAGKMIARLIGEDVVVKSTLEPKLRHVRVDAGQMHQVLLNLAVNARDAMPNGGLLSIETANIDLDESYALTNPDVRPGRYVVMNVSDTGVGMDLKTQARIFEPFFTTKDVDKGTGLGLSTVFGIIKQSGGHITVYSEPNEGTTFRVYLPAVTAEGAPSRDDGPRPIVARGSETVLVVEDEDMVRRLACHALRAHGYTVLEARNGIEALVVFERRPDIHLVVSDVVMPEMGGRQLNEQLQKIKPDQKVLFMSGHTSDAVLRHGVSESKSNFIQKPFSPTQLAKTVREILDR